VLFRRQIEEVLSMQGSRNGQSVVLPDRDTEMTEVEKVGKVAEVAEVTGKRKLPEGT
jgi:hypothetical protein